MLASISPDTALKMVLQTIRAVIQEHTGRQPPLLPAEPVAHAYGAVPLEAGPALMEALSGLSKPTWVPRPLPMEEFLWNHGSKHALHAL